MRAPVLGWAAAMLAAMEAMTPAVNANRAMGRTRPARCLSSTMTMVAAMSIPSTLNGRA